jgi:hypothetical protein
VAPLRLPRWRRGRELLKHNQEFPKTRDCQVNRGFFVEPMKPAGWPAYERHKMNIRHQRIPTEFGPETRFELAPTVVPFRVVKTNRFEQLKGQLLAERLEEIWEPATSSQIRRAANEAAALAWVTPYPLLVFPVLFEEKAQSAMEFSRRQKQIRRRSRTLLSL